MAEMKDAKRWIEEKEKALAKSVLKWKLSKEGAPVPADEALDGHSEKVVKEANRIMKERGKEVLGEIRKGFAEFMKKRIK